jgi:hypothetical protein
MRYCAACAAPLPLLACTACRGENFAGDRYCAFCARPLPGARPAPGAARPEDVSMANPEADELLALAMEARARAAEAQDAPEPTTKRHLDQGDIDAMFGGPQ